MRVADFSLEDLCVPQGLTEVIVRKIRQASRLFICTRCLRNAFVIRTDFGIFYMRLLGRRTIYFITDLLLYKAFSMGNIRRRGSRRTICFLSDGRRTICFLTDLPLHKAFSTGTCESINLPCDGRRTICFLTDLLLHR